MKITKSQLQQVIREALQEEMGMYDPEMSVEGLMEVIKDLDKILLDIFRTTSDEYTAEEAQTAHHMLDKLLGR